MNESFPTRTRVPATVASTPFVAISLASVTGESSSPRSRAARRIPEANTCVEYCSAAAAAVSTSVSVKSPAG